MTKPAFAGFVIFLFVPVSRILYPAPLLIKNNSKPKVMLDDSHLSGPAITRRI